MTDGGFPTVRLAIAQVAPVFLDRDATVDKACSVIREAGAAGADLIAFPEGFIPGHPVWYYHFPALSKQSRTYAERLFHNSVEVPGAATEALCAAARAAHVNVVMGMCERRAGTAGTLWNSQLFIGRTGEILGVHQKLVPTAAERVVHSPGSGAGMHTFPFDFGRVGGLICGENSNPLAINALIFDQARVHVASWPNYFAPGWPPGMSEAGVVTGRAIAYMAKCFVMNACGTISSDVIAEMTVTEDDRKYLNDPLTFGGSTIIAPTGDIVAGPAGPGDEILYADADLELIVRTKLVHDLSGHYQRADVFRFTVEPSDPYASARRSEDREPQRPRRVSAEMRLGEGRGPVDAQPVTPSKEGADDSADRPALSSHSGD